MKRTGGLFIGFLLCITNVAWAQDPVVIDLDGQSTGQVILISADGEQVVLQPQQSAGAAPALGYHALYPLAAAEIPPEQLEAALALPFSVLQWWLGGPDPFEVESQLGVAYSELQRRLGREDPFELERRRPLEIEIEIVLSP